MSTARRSITLVDPSDRFVTSAQSAAPADMRDDFDAERESREFAQRRAVFVARRAREARATISARPMADRRAESASCDDARGVRAWWAAVTARARTV